MIRQGQALAQAFEKSGRTGRQRDAAALIEHAFAVGEALGIERFLIDARAIEDLGQLLPDESRRVILITWPGGRRAARADIPTIEIPVSDFTRITLIRVSLFLALLNDYIPIDKRVICLSSSRRSQTLDTMLIMNPAKEFPWLLRNNLEPLRQLVDLKVFQRLLEISLRFAEEGREGKRIGTIFVLGDPEELDPHITQLVLNPVKGHRKDNRNVHNPQLFESLRELSAIDGAFIVSNQGTVERAGAYLAAPNEGIRLRAGLGARHAAAAAITAHTKSIAIAISESSGTITVFCKGKSILELE